MYSLWIRARPSSCGLWLTLIAMASTGPHSRLSTSPIEQDVSRALADDVAVRGRIDALVNNAGILGAVLPLWETDPGNFRRVIEVNLIGAYLCSRAVLKQMLGQPRTPMRGHVVNVASIQGKEGMPRAGAYSASKAALIALTKTAGKETAEMGITVNCVTPAAAETSMAKELSAERRAEILNRIPMGRFVEVEEIARMIAFLCRTTVSFSTGAAFDISGGVAPPARFGTLPVTPRRPTSERLLKVDAEERVCTRCAWARAPPRRRARVFPRAAEPRSISAKGTSCPIPRPTRGGFRVPPANHRAMTNGTPRYDASCRNILHAAARERDGPLETRTRQAAVPMAADASSPSAALRGSISPTRRIG